MAARRDQSVAVGEVQLRQSLARSGESPVADCALRPIPSAISIALPRWAIASVNAER